MTHLAKLFDWSASLASDGSAALPERVVQTALTIVCDDLSAMIAAQNEPEVARFLRKAAAIGDPNGHGARVLGSETTRVEPRRAGAANAVAANWTELDGGYRPATCHGSLYTLPTALAELEASNGTLGDLVTALTTGYEVVTRVARAYRPSTPLTLHPHASLSPIGAAASLSAARRLPHHQFSTAVLIAASMTMNGPFSMATRGATARNLWAGAAVELGHLAVDAADVGFTAANSVFDDVFDTDGTAVDHAALSQSLGARFAVEDGYHKAYACCQYLHSSVEAAGRLAADSIDTSSIVGVVVYTHALARGLDNRAPETTLAGRFSLPHAVSTVLANRGTQLEAFDSSSLDSDETARLRSLVTIHPWEGEAEPPYDRPSRVVLHLSDGSSREQTVLSAVGGPDRPLTTAQLLEKFSTITRQRQPAFADAAALLMDPSTRPSLDTPLRAVLDTLLNSNESEK